jgi:hypothetical protein
MARTILTAGELFGKASIELLRDEPSSEPRLLLWDGATELIAPSVQHNSINYQPPSMNASLWRELNLPTHCAPPGATRDLFNDIRELVNKFVALPDRFAAIVTRFVLLTWLVEAVHVAPGLLLTGQDVHRANQLLSLLHSLCRHSLRMGGVTSARLYSLPSGMRFTLLISQAAIGDKLRASLDDASRREQKIPYRGGLLDLFGCHVLHSEIAGGGQLSSRFVQVPMVPGSPAPSRLDAEAQHRLSAEFQPRLLGFRRMNLRRAQQVRFDASDLAYPLRELAQSLAAATPDDADMRSQVIEVLQEEDNEIRSALWTDLSTTLIEAVLVVCHEKKEFVYIGELAEIAEEIRMRRGEEAHVDPGAAGTGLKLLGFSKEKRNEGGIRLRITPDVCDRANQLAKDLGLPERKYSVAAAEPKDGEKAP